MATKVSILLVCRRNRESFNPFRMRNDSLAIALQSMYVLVLGICVAAAGTRVEDKRGQDKNPKKIINIPDKLELNYTSSFPFG